MSIIWQEALRVTIPGQPVAKGRPRFYMRGKHPKVHTDAKTKAYEQKVAMVIGTSTALRGQPRPLCGVRDPVRVDVCAVFQRPASLMRKADPDGLVPHAKRPDLDNVVKSLLDGVQGAGGLIWKDDGQVQCIRAESWYAEKGEPPRVELVIYRAVDVQP